MAQLSFFENTEGLQFPEHLLEYYPGFLSDDEATALLHLFISTVPWQQQTVRMYDKFVLTPRLTAWFGNNTHYQQSPGARQHFLPWTNELLDLKNRVETKTALKFDSVLLNYYRDGNDSVAWHSDNEKELGERPAIASLSIGQERQFEFRNKQNHRTKHSLLLANGSLLLMKGNLQEHWEHRIPKSNDVHPRINLPFRIIKNP